MGKDVRVVTDAHSALGRGDGPGAEGREACGEESVMAVQYSDAKGIQMEVTSSGLIIYNRPTADSTAPQPPATTVNLTSSVQLT